MRQSVTQLLTLGQERISMVNKPYVRHMFVIAVLFFCIGIVTGKYINHIKSTILAQIYEWRDTEINRWGKEFQWVHIPSSMDHTRQSAYFSSASSHSVKPLLVSLHTWSGDYSQKDPLAAKAKEHGWNYIHPDFRGANLSIDACLSPKAIADIDDAIQYALDHGSVDRNNIFVVGASGGGYATLGIYLKTLHKIKAFLSWVPISDLSAWYYQSKNRNISFANDILKCTSGNGIFDEQKTKERSPLFFDVPASPKGDLEIYAGIDDGHTGSVPISHSLLFFNKLVDQYSDASMRITTSDMAKLLTRNINRAADLQKIGDREILYTKSIPHISLTIFNGGHEILPEYCFERLMELAAW